jgi:hypothetical protein
VELECIVLGEQIVWNFSVYVWNGGKFCGTEICMFGGQIILNSTVYVLEANFVELGSIC